jgi:class 3 adenylate cyclase
LVVIESVEWARDALSAGELVADQRFRDLFSNEVLAPGIKLAVERATILFTDLVGSTALYNDMGDARAFSLVRTHFDILHEIVGRHNGAIVKTIGDAIMAVFTRPENALQAAHELHAEVDAYVRKHGHERGATLKIGLHEGPCIAVTLNDRLDYFGTTVNLAARVQNIAKGGDILVSSALAEHTQGCAPLAQQGWQAESLSVQAKGFDAPVPVLRFTRDG